MRAPAAATHTRRLLPAALVLTLAVAATLPLLLHGGAASCGQDFDFHLQSWLAVRAAWHAGLAVPHWGPAANYGAGEARFVFYPPLSWLLGALLSFALPWAWVPAAFTALCFGGAAVAMHTAAGRFLPPFQAGAAAVLYALSPYLLFTGLERTAFGELLAAVWMPLLLDALLRDRLPVVRTAVLVALIWYSNSPAGVMASYLVLSATVWAAVRSRDWKDAPLRGGAALALGGLLAADTLLPSWYRQHWVTIARAVGPGMRVEDSFLFRHTGESYHDQVLFTASCIAVATLGAALLSWAVFRFLSANTQAEARTVRLLGILVLLILLLQFRISDPVWHLLPELHFLQFPWRLLLPACAAAALLIALALAKTRPGILLGLALLYAAGMVTWATQTRYQPCDAEDNVAAQLTLLRSGTGFEGTDEYAALGSDNGEIQQGLPPVRLLPKPDADEGDDTAAANPAWEASRIEEITGEIKVDKWQSESLLVHVHPAAKAYAVLRLERFPAWHISLDGRPCGSACVAREDGLVTVQVPGGQWSTIGGRYVTTGDVWLGRGLSLLTLGMLPVIKRRNGRGSRQSDNPDSGARL